MDAMARGPGPAALEELVRSRHWVFDLDGTLTVPVHDFALIRRELGIPAGEDILAHLAALPPARARQARSWLMQHELGLAEAAIAAPGAVALVRALHAAGVQLGILTRNDHALARVTLAAIGLEDCFDPAQILGRDQAAPKPAPDGLGWFAARWQVAPAAMRMVGDHLHDIACAQAAGVPGILLDPAGRNPWPGVARWQVRDCVQLLELWQGLHG